MNDLKSLVRYGNISVIVINFYSVIVIGVKVLLVSLLSLAFLLLLALLLFLEFLLLNI